MDFILSDSSKTNDRGFRIDFAGLDLLRFNANPVMLYNHDTNKVIGVWNDLRIQDGKLIGTPDFDVDDVQGKEIARKVEKGYLKGCSLGIIVREMERVDGVWLATKSELIEASIVAIPSDAGALRLYNDQHETLTFEQVKLSFNSNQNKNQMEVNETFALTATTRESLGLSTTPTAKQIELAVAEKDDTIDKLNKEVKTLKAAEIDAYLLLAVKDGKIAQDDVADQRDLALLNFDKVKAVIDRKPAQASTSLKDMAQKTNLTAGERAGWDYLKWSQDNPKGLEKLRAENPTEYERLLTEYQNKQ